METSRMREAVLLFKAGENKLGFILMPKALANTGILSKIKVFPP